LGADAGAAVAMRVAVISDIHGNCVALEAVLEEIRRSAVDKIVCLGGTVQGGPQPAESIKTLRRLGCPIVMGNADAWLLKDKPDPGEPTSKEQLEVRDWTLSCLSSADLEFMRGFRPTLKVELEGTRWLLCFHGSPLSYDDALYPHTPKEEWERLLGPFAPAIMAGGHTHTQQLRRIREGFYFNPGSVGVAYDHYQPKATFHNDPWAEYVIFSYEEKRSNVQFLRANYDVTELVRVIKASGRPHSDVMIGYYAPSSK